MGVIRITDVSPRDGLQNEPAVVPTQLKADLVNTLAQSGVDEVEVTSFVSRKWIPQLGDAEDLVPLIAGAKPANMVFSALVPNERGMQRLLETNDLAAQRTGVRRAVDKASVFTAASESFSQKNTNASIAETLDRFAPVLGLARAASIPVRGYVSCVIACPFEGPVAPHAVARVAQSLTELGVNEIDLGDTIGAADPEATEALLNAVGDQLGSLDRVTLHLHDTFGRAGACASRAIQLGVRSFDAAVGGLGGCPYASTPGSRAPGNMPIDALLAVIAGGGHKTTRPLDLGALDRAASLALGFRAASESAGSRVP